MNVIRFSVLPAEYRLPYCKLAVLCDEGLFEYFCSGAPARLLMNSQSLALKLLGAFLETNTFQNESTIWVPAMGQFFNAMDLEAQLAELGGGKLKPYYAKLYREYIDGPYTECHCTPRVTCDKCAHPGNPINRREWHYENPEAERIWGETKQVIS